ncbi:hypothetical protein D915_005927 [Fasciola hepatica]|uniref:Uncharacterized protein n=1 Tax=Fasciola hepatica TaxID=6192 RepID=A0A4E0RRD8_FASHE|nr:hypothetical protein D915_005927 [Fasciola hepatica]
MTMEGNENQADQAQKELVESKMSNRNRHSHTYNEGRARLTVESQLDFLEKVVVTNDTIIAWPIRCTDPPIIVQQNDGGNRISNGTSNTGLQPPADSPKEAVLANEKNHPNVSVEVKVDSIAVQHPTNCHALDIQARVHIKQKFNPGRYTQTGTSEFSNTEQKNAVSEVDNAMETTNLGARPTSPIHSFKSCLAFCSPTDPNISGSLTIQGHISPDGRLLITPEGVTTDDRTRFPSQPGHHHERTEAISGSDQGELKSVEPGKTGSIVDPEKSITYVRPGSNCEVQVQENCTFDQNPDGALELHLSRMLQIQPTNQKDDTEHVDGQAIMDTEKVQQLGSPEQTEKEPLGLSVEQADGSRLNESLEMRQTEIETDIPPEVVSPARVSETSIQIADQQADNADNTALAPETVNIVDQEHNGVIEENKTTPRVSASSNREGPNSVNEADVGKTSVEEKEKEDINELKEDSGLEKCPEQLEGVENVDNIQVVEKMDTIGQQKAPEVEVDNETDEMRNLPSSDQLDQEGITSVVQNENLGPPEATAMEMEQSVEQQVGEGDEGLPASLLLGTTEQGEEGWEPTDVQEPQEVESPTTGAETPTKKSEEKTVDVVETGQSDQVNVAESAELDVEKQVTQEVDEGERKLVESQVVDTTEPGEEGLAFTDAEELRELESPISDEEKPSKTQEGMDVDVTVEPSEVAKPETTWEAPEEKSTSREPENKQERPELRETEPTDIRRLSTTSATAQAEQRDKQFHEVASNITTQVLENTVNRLENDQLEVDNSQQDAEPQPVDEAGEENIVEPLNEVTDVAELGERPSTNSKELLGVLDNPTVSEPPLASEVPICSEGEHPPTRESGSKIMCDAEVGTDPNALVFMGPCSDGVDSESSQSLQHFRYRHRRFYRSTGIVSEHATPTFSRHYEKGQGRRSVRTADALTPVANQTNSPSKPERSDGHSSDTQASTESSEYQRMTINLLNTLTTTAELLKTQMKRQSNARARKRAQEGALKDRKASEDLGAVNAQNASCAEPEDWIKLNPPHFLQRSSRNEESNANKRPKRHFSSCSSKDLMRNIGSYAQYKSVVNKHNQGGVIPAIAKFGSRRPNLCCDCSSESKYSARLCATKAGDVSYSKQRCLNKRVPREDKRTLETPDTNGQCHNARSTQVLHEAVEEDEIPLVLTELNLCSISQTQTPVPLKNQTIGPFESEPEFDLHDNPQKNRWFESNYKQTKPDRYSSSLSQDISADCSTQSEQSSHLSNQFILECHKSGQQECHKNLVRPMLCPSTRYKMVSSKNDSNLNAKVEFHNKQNRTTRTTCCSVQSQSHRKILHMLHGESSAVQKIHDVLANSPPESVMSESEDSANMEADHSVVSGTTSASKER